MGSLVLKTFGYAIAFCVAALLVFHANNNETFKDFSGDGFLKDSGAKQAFMKLRFYTQMAYRWSRKNVPLYISNAREMVIPILLVAGDMMTSLAQHVWANLKLFYHFIAEKKPAVVNWIDHYIPGLTEHVGDWIKSARDCAAHLVSLLFTYIKWTIEWIRDFVFARTPSESSKGYTVCPEHTGRIERHSGYKRKSDVLTDDPDIALRLF